MINPIALAIPFFLVLVLAEAAIARAQGRRIYRLNDAIADLGCGVADQVFEVFLKLLTVAAYLWVYAHRAWDPPAWLGWVLAMVGVDLAYYWWHRASHRVNFIWAAHVVHHQSPDYNLAVALRQAAFAGTTSFLFYLPLAVLGVPPIPVLVAQAASLVYQFWIHTELIDRLGPLEWVMNTPSHHRAHHGVNPRYIDKNYGGILIIWDRLFGTFAEETEPVVYGTVTPFRSFDPIRAHLDYWGKLWSMSRETPRIADKLRVWVAPPEWVPPGVAPFEAPPLADRSKHDVDAPRWHAWLVVQWAPMAIVTVGLLLVSDRVSPLWLAPIAGWVFLSLSVFAARFESKAWFWQAEIVRELSLAVGGAAMATALGWAYLAPIPVLVAAASLTWAARIERDPAFTPVVG